MAAIAGQRVPLIELLAFPPERWLAARNAISLSPELAALIKPEWFEDPAGVPMHLLSDDEARALARHGHSGHVQPTPIKRTAHEELPVDCVTEGLCSLLGPCDRAPWCDAMKTREDCR